MNTEELTQVVTAHQSAISRHEVEVAEIRSLARINQEQLNQLTAGLLELRNLVADYIQGRSQT